MFSLLNVRSLALQRESHAEQHGHSPVGPSTPRRSRIWPSVELGTVNDAHNTPEDKPKKKKKGLAKIWGMVTGSSKNAGATSREASQSLDRTEDDSPLTPPPPLSYLVNRGPGDLRTNGRHGSTPSLPSIVSPKPTSAGMSPSTGPSSILSTPPSSRLSGPDVEIVEARKTSGNHEEQGIIQHREDIISKSQPLPRNVHPVISEPDMRQRLSRNISPPPPIPSFPKSLTRPPSLITREKSLPPLPGEPESRSPSNHTLEPRPQTVYSYDTRTPPPGSGPAHDFLPPNAPFRTPDTRRQSFGGLSSRPNLVVQTMPINLKQQSSPDSRRAFGFGTRYDEFGQSRRSLGPLDMFRDMGQTTPASATKRKSRFGFASLLGKKSHAQEPEYLDPTAKQQFPSMRRPGSSGQDDPTAIDYASTSRHSAFSSGGPPTRMSVTSRKALEERVAQDPDFVAYRYPSNDQRLDLLR